MAIHALLLWVSILAPAHLGQARPDFTGDWVLERERSSQQFQGSVVISVAGLLGERFTAVQDARALSLIISAIGRELKVVYNLDGSESRNMNPQGPGLPDEVITSRTSWSGDRLVIQTRGSVPVDGKPVESKRVLWIDPGGLLIIERSAEGSPTTRSVYRRVR